MEFCSRLHLLLKPESMKIQIPSPCHENWDAMTPAGQGAFCSACEKTVIDFSKMTDQEITYYFTSHTDNKICGRFRTDQLQKTKNNYPLPYQAMKRPFYRNFFIAALVSFSTSLYACISSPRKQQATEIQNQVKPVPPIKKNIHLSAGTDSVPAHTLGKIAMPPTPPMLPKDPVKPEKLTADTSTYKLGEPAFIVGSVSPVKKISKPTGKSGHKKQ
jgi:hypothetical protein